ncbi:MAG: sel1 repeat family protein, partial [Lachnospiraceae bacterium]|nr:sel1 repeat family protein [Lachnospiraceae bacterium]
MDEQKSNTAQEPKVLSQEEIDKKIKFGLDILAGDVPMLRGDSAFRAFRDAALAGSAEGKARLADLYYRGVGTERNYEEALRLAEEAAYEENAFGQYILGTMYSDGRAFEKNYAEAFLWFGKAAGQGLPEALYRLGSCYYDGQGVERDLYKARQIFEKAAEAGQPMAEAAVRRIDAVIVKDEQEEERYRKAVGGDRDSFVAILKDCVEKLEGHSCFENALSDKELDIIQKSETTDDPECEYLLSECYREITGNIYGDGLEEAVDKWIGHLKNSALEKGYAPALHKLGNLYRGDSYLEKDPGAAFRCYLQAAENGYHDSMLYLSDCYENGIGTDKDFDLAMEWAQKAYDKAKAAGVSTYPAGSRIHNL